MSVGSALRARREVLNLTLRDLSQHTGFAVSLISAIEHDQIDVNALAPTVQADYLLALKLSVVDLLTIENDNANFEPSTPVHQLAPQPGAVQVVYPTVTASAQDVEFRLAPSVEAQKRFGALEL